MYEIFKIKSSKPIPNFNKNSSILKNSKIFQKPPKPSFQNMKMHENERLGTYQVKKNLENHLKSGLEWERVIWEVRRQRYWERDREKMKSGSRLSFI